MRFPCSWWVTPKGFIHQYQNICCSPLLWAHCGSGSTQSWPPTPHTKPKDWASSPCIWKLAGGWASGYVVPWGQIKARDSYLEAPHPLGQALCSRCKRWSKICYRDRCKHHLREPCSPCLRWEKANKNQVDSGRRLFIFQESSGKSG